jgi:hypothetical protein
VGLFSGIGGGRRKEEKKRGNGSYANSLRVIPWNEPTPGIPWRVALPQSPPPLRRMREGYAHKRGSTRGLTGAKWRNILGIRKVFE